MECFFGVGESGKRKAEIAYLALKLEGCSAAVPWGWRGHLIHMPHFYVPVFRIFSLCIRTEFLMHIERALLSSRQFISLLQIFY